jgi:hypothetical protein
MRRADQPDNRPLEMRGIWLRALLYLGIMGGSWLLLLPLAILQREQISRMMRFRLASVEAELRWAEEDLSRLGHGTQEAGQ